MNVLLKEYQEVFKSDDSTFETEMIKLKKLFSSLKKVEQKILEYDGTVKSILTLSLNELAY